METDPKTPEGADEEVRADDLAPADDANPALEYRRRRAEAFDGARELRRFEVSDLELRDTSDGMLRFSGYASITEHPYEVADFTETISRGAFKRTLSEDPDVVLLVNHDGLPLARTKSGTLTLREDARGLRVDADLNPEDPDVRGLVPKMQRGDVDQMSFAFRATSQSWNEEYTERTIKGVALHRGDVSIVTMGANPATSSSVTTLRSADGTVELRAGKVLSTANETALRGVLDQIAAADEALDEAQPALAAVLGVPDPDADDERAAEPAEVKVISLPDLTSRRRERLAALRGGKR